MQVIKIFFILIIDWSSKVIRVIVNSFMPTYPLPTSPSTLSIAPQWLPLSCPSACWACVCPCRHASVLVSKGVTNCQAWKRKKEDCFYTVLLIVGGTSETRTRNQRIPLCVTFATRWTLSSPYWLLNLGGCRQVSTRSKVLSHQGFARHCRMCCHT